MELIKKIFDFHINSSVHVALGVVSLACISYLNFDLPLDQSLLVFIFFGTITGYNFVKYAGIAKLHHLSLAKNLRLIQIFSLFCFVAFLYFSLKQDWSVLITAAFLGLLTLLYAFPVFRNRTNLRSLTGLKIFVIAFVWAGVTVLLPLINYSGLPKTDVVIEFSQRCLFVIALTLPFEIRDLRFDMAVLGTIPQLYGVKKTRIIGFMLLSLMLLAEFLKDDQKLANALSLLLVAIITSIFLRRARIRQSKYYSSFWVEGIPVMWLCILLLLQQII